MLPILLKFEPSCIIKRTSSKRLKRVIPIPTIRQYIVWKDLHLKHICLRPTTSLCETGNTPRTLARAITNAKPASVSPMALVVEKRVDYCANH